MDLLRTSAGVLLAVLLSSCGYHMGALRNPRLADNKTICVNMFDNSSFYPLAGMQMTNALADALQSDGTYTLYSRAGSDMEVSGCVRSVNVSSLRTNRRDSYVSDEVRLNVKVSYEITERKTGKVLMRGNVTGYANAANQLGNVQSARDDAVSWAVRQAADKVLEAMTAP